LNLYGFEKHFIRGLQKMKLRCTLALMVMLAMAVGRIREKQEINMRSLGMRRPDLTLIQGNKNFKK
jgi:hypothetical protein